MQVEGQFRLRAGATGARVRNAYATYLLQGDRSRKRELIPHTTIDQHWIMVKTKVVADGHASD